MARASHHVCTECTYELNLDNPPRPDHVLEDQEQATSLSVLSMRTVSLSAYRLQTSGTLTGQLTIRMKWWHTNKPLLAKSASEHISFSDWYRQQLELKATSVIWQVSLFCEKHSF